MRRECGSLKHKKGEEIKSWLSQAFEEIEREVVDKVIKVLENTDLEKNAPLAYKELIIRISTPSPSKKREEKE